MLSFFIFAVSAFASAARLSVGEFHSCRANADLTLDCWGVSLASSFGQGNFARTTFLLPVVTPATGVTDVVVGDCYTCYRDEEERLFCAGVLGKFSSSVFREPMPDAFFSSMVGARFDLCAQNADSDVVMCLGGFVASAACGLPLSSFTPPCEALSPISWGFTTQLAISSTHFCVTSEHRDSQNWITLCTGENGGSKHYFSPDDVNTVSGLVPVYSTNSPSVVFVGLVSTCVSSEGRTFCIREGLADYTLDASVPEGASLCYSGASLTGSDGIEIALANGEMLVRGKEGLFKRSGAEPLDTQTFTRSAFSDFEPFSVSSSSTLTCFMAKDEGCVMCAGRDVQRGTTELGDFVTAVFSSSSASPSAAPSAAPVSKITCEEKAQSVLAQCCLYEEC